MRRELSAEGYERIRRRAIDFFGEDSTIVQCAWEQMFGSTACGFGGIAGQAMTSAPVFVFTCASISMVFIGERLAYTVEAQTRDDVDSLGRDILSGNIVEPSRYRGEYGRRAPVEEPSRDKIDTESSQRESEVSEK